MRWSVYGNLCRHTPEVGAVCGKAARTVLGGGRAMKRTSLPLRGVYVPRVLLHLLTSGYGTKRRTAESTNSGRYRRHSGHPAGFELLLVITRSGVTYQLAWIRSPAEAQKRGCGPLPPLRAATRCARRSGLLRTVRLGQ